MTNFDAASGATKVQTLVVPPTPGAAVPGAAPVQLNQPEAPADLRGAAGLTHASAGSAIGGQLHHLRANPARVAAAAAKKRIEVLLETPVTLRSVGEMRTALVADSLGDPCARQFANEHLIPGLTSVAGQTMTIRELIAKFDSLCRTSPYIDKLLAPSMLVTEPALLAELSGARRMAATEEVVVTPLPQLQALLARDVDQALDVIMREAPHSVAIVPELLKLDPYRPLSLDDTLAKFSVHAMPYFVAALNDSDPNIVQRAATCLSNLEGFAASAAPALLQAFDRLEPTTDDAMRARDELLQALESVAPEYVARHPRVNELIAHFEARELTPLLPMRVLCHAGERALPYAERMLKDEETAISWLNAIGPAAWPVVPSFLTRGTMYGWVNIADAIGPPDAAATKALIAMSTDSVHPAVQAALLLAPAKLRDAFAVACAQRPYSYTHLEFAARVAELQEPNSALRLLVAEKLEPLLANERYYGGPFRDLLRVLTPAERSDLIRRALAIPSIESSAARVLVRGEESGLSEDDRRQSFAAELNVIADSTRNEWSVVSEAGRLVGRSPEARAQAIVRCQLAYHVQKDAFTAVRDLIGVDRAVDSWFQIAAERPDLSFLVFADLSTVVHGRGGGTPAQRKALLALCDNPAPRDVEHFQRFDRAIRSLRKAVAAE